MPIDPKLVKRFLVSAAQIRAARALLDWSQTKLGLEAGLSLPTVKRYETGGANVSAAAAEALRAALEKAGIEFIAANRQGAGVRFKRPR